MAHDQVRIKAQSDVYGKFTAGSREKRRKPSALSGISKEKDGVVGCYEAVKGFNCYFGLVTGWVIRHRNREDVRGNVYARADCQYSFSSSR
jgi:hypothetical protein